MLGLRPQLPPTIYGLPPRQIGFDRTEATDLLKTKGGAPGPNPVRTHFGETVVGMWQTVERGKQQMLGLSSPSTAYHLKVYRQGKWF